MRAMKTYRPILTQHRLQRLALWLLTLLHWIAAILSANLPAHARHRRQRGDISLAWVSRWVGALVTVRALNMLRPRPRRMRFLYWRPTFNARPSHFQRSLFGAKLRRALQHKDPATHIAQLIAVLRNLDTYAAELALRIRCRLRRLLRAWLEIAPATPLHGAPAPSPALTDSS
jgi:hypothetical protein